MNFPYFTVSTIDCGCPDIKYSVIVYFDKVTSKEAIIDSYNLIPFLGRTVELLNVHRLDMNKQNELNKDNDEK